MDYTTVELKGSRGTTKTFDNSYITYTTENGGGKTNLTTFRCLLACHINGDELTIDLYQAHIADATSLSQNQNVSIRLTAWVTSETTGSLLTFGSRASTENQGGFTSTLGKGLIANNDYQTVLGKFNDASDTDALFTIGNGAYDANRSNALSVNESGIVSCCDMSGQYSDIFNLLFPVGSIYTLDPTMWSNNPETELSAKFGGTWALVDRFLKYRWITSGVITFNTTYTKNGTSVVIPRGHVVEIRLWWENNRAISDDVQTIATINFASVGLTATHTIYGQINNDGGNAIGLAIIEGGVIKTNDWVTRATSYPSSTSNTCQASFMLTVGSPTELDPNYCSMAAYKRTA